MLASIEQVLERKFDFIVVGGGTCGIVVATRLSEDPDVNVLVLESGTENFGDPSILTPGAFGTTLGKPEYDWCYKTEPQESCGGRVVPWPRGKGLGGSSAMNFFMYHRPAKSDINALEKLGNPGWNWETLRKYYKKAEHFIPPANPTDIMTYDLDERGTDGPLKFILPMTLSGLEAPVQEALATLGIDRVHEPFSGSTKGTWLTPVTNDPVNLVRSYAGNMYLQPNLERQNLVVLTSVHVSKLVLSSKSGKITATGVELVRDGKAYTIRPEKEVILSAGQVIILELSGIGDKSVLERAGVPINLEIPGVGANLQEHIYVDCSYEIRQDRESEFITFDCLRDPAQIPKQIELLKTGKNSVFGLGLTSVTFVPLSSFTPDAASLQEKLVESVRSKSASPGLTKQLEIQLEHIKAQEPSCELLVGPTFNSEPNPPKPDRKYLTLCNLLNHPISRGTIHIKSNNPSEPPAIDPKYFDEPYDLQSFIESFKFKRRLVQQEPLKSILTGEEVNAGPEVQTDEEIAEYCKKYFRTSYHAVGTCSMLPLEDGGVVDSKLKVYNTTNIRVVDVSIIPLHIGAHTQATAYAIAELAADIIKGKA
uniref:Glucose-methanol-choline oxidoreductase N-terminal domain-containing protein n=1 Tax=Moniliophthora roreri TaxID=221103 RepID=A0A0W0G3U5_MONRR